MRRQLAAMAAQPHRSLLTLESPGPCVHHQGLRFFIHPSPGQHPVCCVLGPLERVSTWFSIRRIRGRAESIAPPGASRCRHASGDCRRRTSRAGGTQAMRGAYPTELLTKGLFCNMPKAPNTGAKGNAGAQRGLDPGPSHQGGKGPGRQQCRRQQSMRSLQDISQRYRLLTAVRFGAKPPCPSLPTANSSNRDIWGDTAP